MPRMNIMKILVFERQDIFILNNLINIIDNYDKNGTKWIVLFHVYISDNI